MDLDMTTSSPTQHNTKTGENMTQQIVRYKAPSGIGTWLACVHTDVNRTTSQFTGITQDTRSGSVCHRDSDGNIVIGVMGVRVPVSAITEVVETLSDEDSRAVAGQTVQLANTVYNILGKRKQEMA